MDNELNEQDRLIAAINGSYIAKAFPAFWYSTQNFKSTGPTLKEQVAAKIEANRLKRSL